MTLAGLLPALGVLEVLIAVVVLLVARQYYRAVSYWKRKGIPSHPGIPLLGSAPAFLLQREYRGYSSASTDARAKDEPCVGLILGTRPVLLLTDVDLIRTVMSRDFQHFMDRGLPYDRHGEPLTANLFNLRARQFTLFNVIYLTGFPEITFTKVKVIWSRASFVVKCSNEQHFDAQRAQIQYVYCGPVITVNKIKGAEWRSLRHKLTPTFTSGRMRAMFPLLRACADELEHVLAAEAASGKPVEMFELLARFTTDVIGSCAFGIQANTLKDPEAEFRAMGKRAFEIPKLTLALVIVLPQLLPFFKKLFSLRLVDKDVTNFFTRVFQETIENRQQSRVLRHDFVDLLMQIKTKGQLAEDDGSFQAETAGGIDEDILPAQAFVFFLAGFETSSSALGNVMTELAYNPDVQDKARAEVERVLAKHGGVLSYEALGELTYVERVIEETMRLYPAASNMVRLVTQDYALPFKGKDGQAAVLEKGTTVIIPTYALHRDPEYFPDPDRFDPERFTEENKQGRPHYCYLPFGDGPRVCIGLRFAMMQMKSGLATVLHKFRVSPVEGANDYPATFEAATFVTKVKGGNKVYLHPVPVDASSRATR